MTESSYLRKGKRTRIVSNYHHGAVFGLYFVKSHVCRYGGATKSTEKESTSSEKKRRRITREVDVENEKSCAPSARRKGREERGKRKERIKRVRNK
jgi:hypothetical protein